MENTLIAEINQKTIQTYLFENQFGQDSIFKNFFPFKFSSSLKYETLVGTKGNPVVADVVTYNSSAPLKSRKVVSKLTGSIPPIKIKRRMEESDLNDYNQLKNVASDDGQMALLDFIFEDTNFCVEGTIGRLDWLTGQALSQSYITLTKSNNNGVITAENIDFQMPSINKRVVKSADPNRTWTSSTTPEPITDLQDIANIARENGVRLAYVLMNFKKWMVFKSATQVIQAVANSTLAFRSPTLVEVNEFLVGQGLPEIKIIDKYIEIENADGTTTNTDIWTEKYITFIPMMMVGNMMAGPIAAETNPPKQSTQSKIDGILVQKYSDVDPVVEYTVAQINAFPSWPTVDRCYRLDTEATPQADGLDN